MEGSKQKKLTWKEQHIGFKLKWILAAVLIAIASAALFYIVIVLKENAFSTWVTAVTICIGVVIGGDAYLKGKKYSGN